MFVVGEPVQPLDYNNLEPDPAREFSFMSRIHDNADASFVCFGLETVQTFMILTK